MAVLTEVVRYFRLCWLLCVTMPLWVITLIVAKYISSSVGQRLKKQAGPYYDSMFSVAFVKQRYKSLKNDIMKDASAGQKAFNAPVLSLESRSIVKLLDFQKKGRPLILNFGSCT
ncbi:Thyroxine 5-deiodinase [Mactra antiquata]